MAQTVIHQFKITGPQMSLTFVAPIGLTNIGRQANNDLVFVHPLVSRLHARLNCTAEVCHVIDLGSTHGTTINRERLDPEIPVRLKSDDVVEIGAFQMVYEQILVGEPDPAPVESTEESAASETAADAEAETDETAPETAAATTPTAAPEPEYGPLPDSTSQTREIKTAVSLPPLVTPSPATTIKTETNGHYKLLPGLSFTTSRYLQYLPDIYQYDDSQFIPRFLALLESILAPIEWNIDNFDLYLDPATSPISFLPWLANWYEVVFDETWSEISQRILLSEAHHIYSRRGTKWALSRTLQIYTGRAPEIDDSNENLPDFTFSVRLPLREQEVNRAVIERIIDANKPAHTTYTLIFQE